MVRGDEPPINGRSKTVRGAVARKTAAMGMSSVNSSPTRGDGTDGARGDGTVGARGDGTNGARGDGTDGARGDGTDGARAALRIGVRGWFVCGERGRGRGEWVGCPSPNGKPRWGSRGDRIGARIGLQGMIAGRRPRSAGKCGGDRPNGDDSVTAQWGRTMMRRGPLLARIFHQ